MEEPITNEDSQLNDTGHGEEPTGQDPGQVQASGDENEVDWSMNDVPDAMRPEVEKFVKHYQSQVTPKLMRLSDLEKQSSDWSSGKGESERMTQELNQSKGTIQRLIKDDTFRNELRTRFGVQGGQVQQKPEGWDNPEAVQARNLLWGEFAQQFQQATGLNMQDLRGISQKANQAESLRIETADKEYTDTKTQIEKEGKPFNDEIFDACLGVIQANASKGRRVSLRDAYNSIINPLSDHYKKIQASKDQKKVGRKPFAPTLPGGKGSLTGDAKLMNDIDNLDGLDGIGW